MWHSFRGWERNFHETVYEQIQINELVSSLLQITIYLHERLSFYFPCWLFLHVLSTSKLAKAAIITHKPQPYIQKSSIANHFLCVVCCFPAHGSLHRDQCFCTYLGISVWLGTLHHDPCLCTYLGISVWLGTLHHAGWAHYIMIHVSVHT